MIDAIRELAKSYDPKLPDSAIITVSNEHLRLLKGWLDRRPDWTGFDYIGSEIARPGVL